MIYYSKHFENCFVAKQNQVEIEIPKGSCRY